MLTILAVAAAAFGAGPLSAAELVPHEAEYKVTLVRYLGSGNIQSFEGNITERRSRDCQKWKLEGELTYNYYLRGEYREIRVSQTFYEALDGSRAEYNAKGTYDGVLEVWDKGSARRGDQGKPGTVTYRKPPEGKAELPAGTMFLVAADAESIANLAAGKKQWTQIVFDRGDILNVSTTVTKSGVAATVAPAGDADLVSGAAWVVKNKEFDRQSNELLWEYEQTIHENGVVSRYVENNVLASRVTLAELVRIERLPVPQC